MLAAEEMPMPDSPAPQSRHWLVTGCSAGFGRVLAEELIGRGHAVTVTARRPDTLADLVALAPGRVHAERLDVTDHAALPAAIAGAEAALGPLDVLVNNAGGGHFGTIEDSPIADARAMMELNYFGAMAVIQAVLPGMIARRSGRIINVGSVAGQIGFAGVGLYAAAKSALAGMSEALAAEVAPLGIKVTLAELGPFTTNFMAAMHQVPPSPHYDLAAASRDAGNAGWAYDDPARAVRVLVDVALSKAPPRRFVLGVAGVKVVALHAARRAEEAARWAQASLLESQSPA